MIIYMYNSTAWLWFISAAVAATTSIAAIQKYAQANDKKYLIVAIVFIILANYLYLQIARRYNLTTAYPFIKILAITLVVIAGLLFFGNKLTKTKIAGLILGFIAIYLLEQK
jgi:multidrug transporter EmrE-like cation transporter